MATSEAQVLGGNFGPGLDPSGLPPGVPKRLKGTKPDAKPEPGSKKSATSPKQSNAAHAENVSLAEAADETDFWELLGSFSGDQWQNLIMYLWRVEPITDRRTGGKPTHIQKYSYFIDIDTVMKEWGSGIYRLDLCQVNPATGGSKRIRQHFFSINNPNYPPNVPLGDWIEESSNSMWKPFKAKMVAVEAERAGALAPNPQQSGTSASDANALFQTIFTAVKGLGHDGDETRGLAGELLRMLTSQQAQMFAMSDPKKQMEFVDSLLRQRAPAAADPMLTFLQTELRESRQALTKALERMDEMKSELLKPRDVIEDIERIGGAMERFGGMFGYRKGGAKADHENGVVGLVDKVVDKVTEQLPAFFSYLESRERNQAMANNRNAPPPNNWPPPPAAAPAATPPNPTQTSGPGVTAEQVETERRNLEQLGMKFENLLTPAAPFMVDHFTRQLSGYDLRDWFREAHGAVNWVAMKNEIGPERLTAMVVMHPQLTNIMKPPEEVLEFFKEFFTEPGQEPDEDDDEGGPMDGGRPLGDGENKPHG
jgi:hypothetical protein